VGTKETNIAY